MKHNNILLAWRLLYFTYGLFPIIVGLDKFFGFLAADWSIYMNAYIPTFFNMTSATFMYAIGIIEILAGLLVFFRPLIGGYVTVIMLAIIIINLMSIPQYDTAARATAMAVGAYVFVLLSRKLQK
jgi:hypothetical protein